MPIESHSTPWYRRPPPTWLPPWLAISLTFAVGFAIMGWSVGERSTRTLYAVGGAFLLGVVFSTIVGWRLRPEARPGFLPPALLRRPVMLAAVSLTGYLFLSGALNGQSHRLSPVLAVIVGVFALLAVVWRSVAALREQPRSAAAMVAGVVGLATAAVGVVAVTSQLQ